MENAIFLRADRQTDGRRTFKLLEGTSAEEQFEKGKLKFELLGKKLKGAYNFFKLGQRDQWRRVVRDLARVQCLEQRAIGNQRLAGPGRGARHDALVAGEPGE